MEPTGFADGSPPGPLYRLCPEVTIPLSELEVGLLVLELIRVQLREGTEEVARRLHEIPEEDRLRVIHSYVVLGLTAADTIGSLRDPAVRATDVLDYWEQSVRENEMRRPK